MTDNPKQAWNEVGEKFASWGRRVAAHYGETGTADAAAAEENERELRRAAKELLDTLSRGFSTVGKTFRDEQAGKELVDAVGAIGDAITATVNEASEAIRAGKTGAQPPPGGTDRSDDEGNPEGPTAEKR